MAAPKDGHSYEHERGILGAVGHSYELERGVNVILGWDWGRQPAPDTYQSITSGAVLTNPVAAKNIYFIPRNYLQDATSSTLPSTNSINPEVLKDGTSRIQTQFRAAYADRVLWTFVGSKRITAVGIFNTYISGVCKNAAFKVIFYNASGDPIRSDQFSGSDYGAFKLYDPASYPGLASVHSIEFRNENINFYTNANCGEMYAGEYWQPTESFASPYTYEPGVIGEDNNSEYECLNRDVHSQSRQFTLSFSGIINRSQIQQWEAMHLESQKHVLVDSNTCHYKAYPAMIVLNDLAYLMMLPQRLSFEIVQGQGHKLNLTLTEEGHDL